MQEQEVSMRPIAVFVLVGLLSLSVGAASAKTVTVPQKDNDRVVAGVSGATPGKDTTASKTEDGTSRQPSKKTLKASKVRTPPPMHDPN
jgi:hypothetical protein